MYNMIKIMTALMLSLMCSGCNKQIADTDDIMPSAPADPIQLTKAEESVNSAANAFGLDVFRKINETKGINQMFISPLSLSLAMAMTATGADGETEAQMMRVMGFDGCTSREMGGYFKKMSTTLLGIDPSTTLEIANAIWVDKHITLNPEYVRDVKDWYSSEASSEDMNSPATIKKINGWCSDHTSGKINGILDEDDKGIVTLLANALYFKGTWMQKFERTFDGKFKGISGKVSKAKMMSLTRDLKYSKNAGWSMVELPYGNGAFLMDVLLPDGSFKDGVAGLDTKAWESLTDGLRTGNIHVEMPAFKMDYAIELKEILISLGMKDAFSGAADFSRMSSSPMSIDFVRQKTFVDVNENGTEAAAVTAIGMKLTSAGPAFTIDFIADRPFVYAIREASTGALIFIGQKVD